MRCRISLTVAFVLLSLAIQAQYINNEQNTVQAGANFNIGGSGAASYFRGVQTSANSGNWHFVMTQSPGTVRWALGTKTAESGNGTGSDFSLFSYADNGDFLSEPLTIRRSNGYLGLGEANPAARFHIGTYLQQTAIKIGKLHDAGNINVPIGASCGGYDIDFYGWRDVYADQVGARIRAERINAYYDNNALVQAMDIAFSTSTGADGSSLTEKMRIKSDGKVGIGVSKPQYELTVNGTIGGRKVKVTQETWADFVFESSYQLRSIPELQAFIKENGHLPEVPKAEEVKNDGLDLGEMDTKLLQKIEELTLYIIEQHKQIQELRADMEKMKEQKR
jgi:hypothetical protein